MAFDTERFIIEIYNRSSIWDSSTSDYSNRDLKRKSWEEIVDIFGGAELDIPGKKELGKYLNYFFILMNAFILPRKYIFIYKIFGEVFTSRKGTSPSSGRIPGSTAFDFTF